MIDKKNHKISDLKVLVAPLDWGLGHATRCVPIIKHLLQQQIKVFVAAEEGPVKLVLQTEVPDCTFLNLKGYRIQYPQNSKWLLVKLLIQIPRISAVIAHEKRWLKAAVAAHGIDAVIADNRFGLTHPNIPCAYITHQLHIETGNKLLNSLAQHIHYRYINQYNQCWVPDFAEFPNLAGLLSHPKKLPKTPVSYMGPLSRFTKKDEKKQYDLLILLSGIEPQRTQLENKLLLALPKLVANVVFVRGLPGNHLLPDVTPNVTMYNYVYGEALRILIQQSKLVLARSGYSTVMDLAALEQAAVLIPTPGQTEQLYLGKWLKENEMFCVESQKNFNLANAIENIRQKQNMPKPPNEETQHAQFSAVIKQLFAQ